MRTKELDAHWSGFWYCQNCKHYTDQFDLHEGHILNFIDNRVAKKQKDDPDCSSCGYTEEESDIRNNECPQSRRPCGHHCNCSWTQDECCWCGKEFEGIIIETKDKVN